jgi:putative ABC transport system substrate-binding protein
MRRREFITFIGGAALTWPLAAQAQSAPRIGWIFPGASAGNPTELAGFKEGLRELGYVEGRNIVVEYRFGQRRVERLAEFATELARLNVNVIVALGETATRAARRGAPDTPIVFLSADPGNGLVSNLSRPGGNMTGVSVMRGAGKWPELAKEALPALTRIGYLINPTNAASVTTLNEARRSAEALGLDFRSYAVERPADLESAFDGEGSDRLPVARCGPSISHQLAAGGGARARAQTPGDLRDT